MTLHNITENFVEKQRPPAAGEDFYRDKALRGFALRVNWGGTKSFILECRVKGRPRRMTLGRWPVMSVVSARNQAKKVRGVIADGVDPTAATDKTITFEALVLRYVEYSKQHDKKSWRQDERALELYVPKAWQKRSLSDITRDEIVKLHGSVGREHGHYSANRLMALVRAMFNFAIGEIKVFKGENPVSRIKMFKEDKRKRFLSPEELQRVNEALLQEPDPYWRAYFPLVCMLGTRRMELLSAKWTDIDPVARTWELPKTKNGESHLLPLPAPALAILERLPSRGASEWVFPGRGRTGHIVEPKAAWERIRERADVSDVRIHDLRRTLGSWLAAAGYGLPMIGRALNHASPASTAVYARLALDPVRTMLEANAEVMFGSAK